MTNNEIKFLEYLDKSVEWEKEKQIALKKATKPFNKEEILKIIEDFEIKKIKTIGDCVDRMKMIKVSNNTFARREFLSIIREDFNNIDFQKLLTNPIYLTIKNEILKNNPDLTFVDDKFESLEIIPCRIEGKKKTIIAKGEKYDKNRIGEKLIF